MHILLVDDFELWRAFVQTCLNQNENLRVVGVASDGLQAVEKAKELQPDLVLLDVGLPKLNGVEAAIRIRNIAPRSAILFLSDSPDPRIMDAALAAGGLGYVLKSEIARDLVVGIEAVLRGVRFVSRELWESRDPT